MLVRRKKERRALPEQTNFVGESARTGFTGRDGSELRSQPGCQKWRAHAAGIPACGRNRRGVAARVRLRGAIWRVPPAEPQCPGAVFPRNARAKTNRRKTPPPAADT